MAESETKVDLGLAEFVAKLISETFEAIVISLVYQAGKHADLDETTQLGLGELAARVVSDAEVDGELLRLFPSEDDPDAHRVFLGATYEPPKEDGSGEVPAFRSAIGVRLASGDTRKRGSVRVLTTAGVDRIRAAVRLALAESRYDSLLALARDGIPRVVIDSGRISSRVTFEIHELGESDTAHFSPAKSVHTSFPLGKLPVRSWAPPNVRMLVKQADAKAPQLEKSGHVFGEVEITFKTVQ